MCISKAPPLGSEERTRVASGCGRLCVLSRREYGIICHKKETRWRAEGGLGSTAVGNKPYAPFRCRNNYAKGDDGRKSITRLVARGGTVVVP